MNQPRIRAFIADYRSHVNITLQDGANHFAKNIVFEQIEDNAYIRPSLEIGIPAAQELMDDLWQAGLRPSEGTGSAGSLKATENHLKDMRKILFKQLDLEG